MNAMGGSLCAVQFRSDVVHERRHRAGRGVQRVVAQAQGHAGGVSPRGGPGHDGGPVGGLPAEEERPAGFVEQIRGLEGVVRCAGGDDQAADARLVEDLRHLRRVAGQIDVPHGDGLDAQMFLQPAFAQIQLADESFAAGGQFPGPGVEGAGLDDARLHQPLDGAELVGMAAEILADIQGVFHGEAVARHRFRKLDRLGERLDVGGQADFRRIGPTEVGVRVGDDEAAIAEDVLAAGNWDHFPPDGAVPPSTNVIWTCCCSGDSETSRPIPTAPAAGKCDSSTNICEPIVTASLTCDGLSRGLIAWTRRTPARPLTETSPEETRN